MTPTGPAPRAGRLKGYGNTTIKHHYKITNNGPSRTGTPYAFQLYVPAIVSEDDVNVTFAPFNKSQIQCESVTKKGVNIPGITKDKKDVSCNSMGCIVYDCKVEKGWDASTKDKTQTITIETTFAKKKYHSLKRKLPEGTEMNFWTALANDPAQTADGAKTFSVRKTRMIYDNAGDWRRTLASYWPLIIGVFIGLVVLSAISIDAEI